MRVPKVIAIQVAFVSSHQIQAARTTLRNSGISLIARGCECVIPEQNRIFVHDATLWPRNGPAWSPIPRRSCEGTRLVTFDLGLGILLTHAAQTLSHTKLLL
jgi:hypothetical protein